MMGSGTTDRSPKAHPPMASSTFRTHAGIPLPPRIATPYRIWLGVHGAIFAVLGAVYVTTPDRFSGFPVYEAIVGLVPLQVWGVLFILAAGNAFAAGLLGRTWHCIWSIVIMGFAVGVWSAAIFAASFILHTLQSPTVLAFAAALIADYALFCFLSLYPRDTIDAPLDLLAADGA